MKIQHWLGDFAMNPCKGSKDDLLELNNHEEYHPQMREEG